MNYFPSLLLFSFSQLSRIENGCKWSEHRTPTPTKETAAGAILKGHHRPKPEAAEPPTEERPDPKTPTRHPDKRQQERPRNDPNRPTEPPEAEPRQPDRTPAKLAAFPKSDRYRPRHNRQDNRPPWIVRRNGNKSRGHHHKRQRGNQRGSKPTTRADRTHRPLTTPKADKEHRTKNHDHV